MKVDAIWSEPHYADHILPIWEALPEEYRGVKGKAGGYRPDPRRVALVASWHDLQPLRGSQKMIYVEHGAGQSYEGDEKSAHWPGYSGSGGQRHGPSVIGYLCPSERVAAKWTNAPAAVVGCPKLDRFINAWPEHTYGIVTFAWHWDCQVAPESRSAFAHYEAVLPEVVARLKKQGLEVWGHAHPKWYGALDWRLEAAGLEVHRDVDEVLRSTGVLVMDNSSLMYEVAALGRMVYVLNAPWYRRDINHGLRFWEAIPGLMIDEPEELLEAQIYVDLVDGEWASWAEAATRYAYGDSLDGKASERAAAQVVDWVRALL